jgi:hypothetical protein
MRFSPMYVTCCSGESPTWITAVTSAWGDRAVSWR